MCESGTLHMKAGFALSRSVIAHVSEYCAFGMSIFGHHPLEEGGRHVLYTVDWARGGVRNTSGITWMSPPGATGGRGEARGVPHLGPAPLE